MISIDTILLSLTTDNHKVVLRSKQF